jgi:hypothetical protein
VIDFVTRWSMVLLSTQIGAEGREGAGRRRLSAPARAAATSFLGQWNSVQSACFGKVSLPGVNLARVLLRILLKPAPGQMTQRFEHYELIKGADGKPIELGRGAMGITYKAFDVDLHCPVTLKVISERYVGDESASFVSFGKRARRQACAIQTLLRFSIWAKAQGTTSMRWSSWRARRWRILLNVRADWM